MKNIIPKTYNEVIRKKRCYDLAKYYIISDEILVEIYNFLSSGDDCRMSATRNLIALYRGKNMEKSIPVTPKLSSFDGINLSNSDFVIGDFWENGFEFTFVVIFRPLCIKTHIFLPN